MSTTFSALNSPPRPPPIDSSGAHCDQTKVQRFSQGCASESSCEICKHAEVSRSGSEFNRCNRSSRQLLRNGKTLPLRAPSRAAPSSRVPTEMRPEESRARMNPGPEQPFAHACSACPAGPTRVAFPGGSATCERFISRPSLAPEAAAQTPAAATRGPRPWKPGTRLELPCSEAAPLPASCDAQPAMRRQLPASAAPLELVPVVPRGR